MANNVISLNSKNHIQQMEILLNNSNIGAFLYVVMTDIHFTQSRYYYRLIDEMIEYSDYLKYVILLCIYAGGIEKTKSCVWGYNEDLSTILQRKDLVDLLKKVEERLDIIDGDCNIYEVNYIESEENQSRKRIFSKVKYYLLKKC